MYKYFLINLFLVNVCFNLEHLTPNYLFNQRNNSSTSDIILQTDDFNYIIGIMVDFPIEREEFQDLDSNGSIGLDVSSLLTQSIDTYGYRLLKNTKEIYKLDGKNKSDINPIELMETIDALYHSCLVNGKPNQLFGFL